MITIMDMVTPTDITRTMTTTITVMAIIMTIS
jgi:hypothetical protein